MQKLIVFNHQSLDGYFVDRQGSMRFAKPLGEDAEWNDFVTNNASGNGTLLFGRVTYELMVQYWPTPAAAQQFPAVADGMNRMPKVVFSRTLEKASWANTRLVKADMAGEVKKMKAQSGSGLVILGSGQIISQLAQEGLIDEYQVVMNPVALGKGRTMFDGIAKSLSLKLVKSRTFKNGYVVLCYEPLT